MQNFDIKTGSAARIRKATKIIGIFAVVAIFLSNMMHLSGISSYETPTAKDWMKLPLKLVDAGRWIAIAALFLALTVACLLIAHSIMQLVKLNKTNVKSEVTAGTVNAIVAIVILAFVIYALTMVFDKEKWCYFTYDGEFMPFVYLGGYVIATEKTAIIFAIMGIIFVSVLYATIFAGAYNRNGIVNKETNIKMLRTVSLFMFSAAMIGIGTMSFGAVGGFTNFKKIGEIEDANKRLQQVNETWASIFQNKFTLGIIGGVALMALTMIPFGILGLTDAKQKKNNIILYSILGGITLILFIVGAALMKIGDLDKFIDVKESPKLMSDTETATAMVFVGWVSALVTGSIAFNKTKKFDPKLVKQVVAAHPAQ